MTSRSTALDIRKTIIVDADPTRAFNVFTAAHGSWWPAVYHIGEGQFETAVIEPRERGRWYERSVDGTECDWGRVLVWDPPSRLVLAWQINADWQFDPDLVTEIEVEFDAVAPGQTRVTLEHRNLDRFGPRAGEMHAVFSAGGLPGAPQGWAGLLKTFAAAIHN